VVTLRKAIPMHDSRFDALTRAVTTAHSRRGALSTLLGGALGLLGLAETTARKKGHHTTKHECPPCTKRKHGKCKATKRLQGTGCPGGTCQDGACVLSVEQTTTCPTGACSRSRPCGSGCVCLDIGGSTKRCLAVGTCSGVGVCERGSCGSGCTCVNPGGGKTGCVSVGECPAGRCSGDSCGPNCICVGDGAATRCASVVP
jgi:hypothetical protein